MKKPGYYSSGQFARMANVTLRTIRYYDKQDILKPSFVSEAGARFYTDKDFARLQQVLLLKYLGFSLEDIKEMLIDEVDDHFMMNSLNIQLKLVQDKIEQMQLVEKAIRDTAEEIRREHAIDWNQMLNLIHLRKKRKADYIVVLGAGLTGSRVTPLLAARIEKGIELLDHNPKAALIMSGGQGPGEDIPEGRAMADYAIHRGVDADKIIVEDRSASTEENLLFSRELKQKERPRVIVVTTAYHVFRALLLARQQKMACVGFGARTKWYFTLNALLREFIGYLSLTWKRHAVVALLTAGGVALIY